MGCVDDRPRCLRCGLLCARFHQGELSSDFFPSFCPPLYSSPHASKRSYLRLPSVVYFTHSQERWYIFDPPVLNALAREAIELGGGNMTSIISHITTKLAAEHPSYTIVSCYLAFGACLMPCGRSSERCRQPRRREGGREGGASSRLLPSSFFPFPLDLRFSTEHRLLQSI